jgi:DNA-binding transcriptional MerR regulator
VGKPYSQGVAVLISEIARITGLSKDGVRHYEEMGLIASQPRPAGSRSYRDYDPAVIDTIEKVRQAQRLGFSLKEIGPILKAHAQSPPSHEQTVRFLEDRLTVIRGRIAELREVENFIRGKLKRYRTRT